MSHLAQIPLESYLLAQQAAPIDCLVCRQENCRSATRLPAISRAPDGAAHQAESVKQQPKLIAVLGATGWVRRRSRHVDGHPDAPRWGCPTRRLAARSRSRCSKRRQRPSPPAGSPKKRNTTPNTGTGCIVSFIVDVVVSR